MVARDRRKLLKIILVVASMILLTPQARAEGCPDFFRFVDFGLETPDGTTRGGPTYRAESFDGQALLIRERTICRDVRDVARDGRGNPIPIVKSINYDPEKTGVDLKELRLQVVDDIASEAEQNAADHLARLENQTVVVRRGSDYLCVSLEEAHEISCQLVSPFGSNLALVVYCDLLECRMPALALNEKTIAVASWLPSQASQSDHEAAVSEILGKVQQIHGFLEPLSSWRPDFTRFD